MHPLPWILGVILIPWSSHGARFTEAQSTAGQAVLGSSAVIDVGWQEEAFEPADWVGEEHTLPDADATASVTAVPGGLDFRVGDRERPMQWARFFPPVPMVPFDRLEIRYELHVVGSAPPVVWLHDDRIGPTTAESLAVDPTEPPGLRFTLDAEPGLHQHLLVIPPNTDFDRIAAIRLRLAGGTRFVLRGLRLRVAESANSPDAIAPKEPANGSPLPPAGRPLIVDRWEPIALPAGQSVSAADLARVYRTTPAAWPDDDYRVADIHYVMSSARAALATSLWRCESIVLEGDWQGVELALLMGTRVFHWPTDRPVQSKAAEYLVDTAHQVRLELGYADGTVEACMPWSVIRRQATLNDRPEPYVVPLDPARRLRRIVLHDRLSAGQIFLLAASVHAAAEPLFPEAAGPVAAGPPMRLPEPRRARARWVREDDGYTLANRHLEMVLQTREGPRLAGLRLPAVDRGILVRPDAGGLVRVLDGQGQPLAMQMNDQSAQHNLFEVVLEWTWRVGAAHDGHRLRLKLSARDEGAFRLQTTLVNNTREDWATAVESPHLAGLCIADDDHDRHYLIGTADGWIGHEPTDAELAYGGAWPFQLVDLFALRAGGGLGCWIEDQRLNDKQLIFRQGRQTTEFAVRYPAVVVPAGQSLILPTAVLFPHAGDWHELLGAYRPWARAEREPARIRPLSDAFFCRTDLPLNGSGMLYTPTTRRYRIDTYLDASTAMLGGVDLLVLRDWAVSVLHGRCGAYLSGDLGGPEAVRDAIREARERACPLALSVEGYRADRRSPLGDAAFPDWQMFDAAGHEVWDARHPEELLGCLAMPGWYQSLSDMTAQLVADTEAEVLLLNDIGVGSAARACWCPLHGHAIPSAPLANEHRLLEAIRRALDPASPHTALCLETLPAVSTIPLIDAVRGACLDQDRGRHHPAHLPLGRYLFPELAYFDRLTPTDRPTAIDPHRLHLCLFHGIGIELTGRPASWCGPDFPDAARRAYRILHEQADLLRSPACEPLIPTCRPGLYANRFGEGDRVMLTLYNSLPRDVQGELCDVGPGLAVAQELWDEQPAELRPQGQRVTLFGRIPPHCTRAYLLTP